MNATHRWSLLGALLLSPGAVAQSIIGYSNPNGFAGSYFLPYALFAANDQTSGMEPWRLDRTTGAATLLADLHALGSHPRDWVLVVGLGVWLFTADDGVRGTELWRSDGTTLGTTLVADLFPGAAGSVPRELVAATNGLWFTADDGSTGRELWRSDGTANGTTRVADIHTSGDAEPSWLVPFGNRLLFAADDGVHGRELWISDGTASGTQLVVDLVPGAGGANPHELTLLQGGRVVFVATTPATGPELFVTDGTAAGTGLVRDIRPGTIGSNPSGLFGNGSWLLCVANDGTSGREPWASDGTSAGTRRVLDVNPGAPGSGIRGFARGPSVFDAWFVADDGSHGREPWRIGSNGNAVLVADLVPGAGTAEPEDLVRIDGTNRLLFTATLPGTGREPWSSDGTVPGTGLVADIRPGPLGSEPGGLFSVPAFPGGPMVLFAANDGTRGIEPWRSDGTQSGTQLVANIAPDTAGAVQPMLDGHVAPGGSQVSLCVEGAPPLAFSIIVAGFPPSISVPLPGVLIGNQLLVPAATLGVGLASAGGQFCVSLTLPSSLPTTFLINQGAYFEPSLSQFPVSDLASIAVVKQPFINGGPVSAVGSFDDDNHRYEVEVDLPSVQMPDTGVFAFEHVLQVGSVIHRTPLDKHTYAYDRGEQGLHVRFTGVTPLEKITWLQLWFVGDDGTRWFVWQSYC